MKYSFVALLVATITISAANSLQEVKPSKGDAEASPSRANVQGVALSAMKGEPAVAKIYGRAVSGRDGRRGVAVMNGNAIARSRGKGGEAQIDGKSYAGKPPRRKPRPYLDNY